MPMIGAAVDAVGEATVSDAPGGLSVSRPGSGIRAFAISHWPSSAVEIDLVGSTASGRGSIGVITVLRRWAQISDAAGP